MTITQKPASPHNYDVGRAGHTVKMIVIHVEDGSESGSAAWFANPGSNVCAHYGVSSAGAIDQFCDEANTAFHAGNYAINQTSIGVEHEGQPRLGPWAPTEAQLSASAALVADICKRHGITPSAQTIVPHSSINPNHHCPGPTWPWARYLGMVQALLAPQAAHRPSPADQQTVRLYDPSTNQQVGTGTLIVGTGKVYIAPTVKHP